MSGVWISCAAPCAQLPERGQPLVLAEPCLERALRGDVAVVDHHRSGLPAGLGPEPAEADGPPAGEGDLRGELGGTGRQRTADARRHPSGEELVAGLPRNLGDGDAGRLGVGQVRRAG